MKRYVIDSVRDIRELFTDLQLRIQDAFSPEDDLETMVDAAGSAVFSKAEAAYFDDIILDCFVFCDDFHLDLHEIVEGIQQELRVTTQPKPGVCNRRLQPDGFYGAATMLYPPQQHAF